METIRLPRCSMCCRRYLVPALLLLLALLAPQQCAAQTRIWSTLGGDMTAVFGNFIVFLAADSAGNVYLSDMSQNCISKFTSAGAWSIIGGTCGTSGFNNSANGGLGLFNEPLGIAVTPDGSQVWKSGKPATSWQGERERDGLHRRLLGDIDDVSHE